MALADLLEAFFVDFDDGDRLTYACPRKHALVAVKEQLSAQREGRGDRGEDLALDRSPPSRCEREFAHKVEHNQYEQHHQRCRSAPPPRKKQNRVCPKTVSSSPALSQSAYSRLDGIKDLEYEVEAAFSKTSFTMGTRLAIASLPFGLSPGVRPASIRAGRRC